VSPAPPEPVLLRGGTVWADDPPSPSADWIDVRDGRVARIGGIGDEPPDPPGAVVELDGAHVIPGITDPHTHVLYAAMRTGITDGSGLKSPTEAVEAVRELATRTPEGSWIVLLGVNHRSWQERRRPTRDELDEAAGDRLVLLADETIHEGIANSAALRASGVRWMPDGHGDIDRDRKGRPTGLVWERAFGRVALPAMESLLDDATGVGPDELIDRMLQRLLAAGVVRIHEGAVPPSLIPVIDAARERTPMEISWSVTDPAGQYDPPARLDQLAEIGFGDGPAWVKLFADGGHRCAVSMPVGAALTSAKRALQEVLSLRDPRPLAALTERRTTLSGRRVEASPELRFDDDELAALLSACESAGIRPRVHAIGDLAATQIAGAARRAGIEIPWSLEHAMFLRDGDAERIADGAHVVNIQPRLVPDYVGAVREVGAEKAVTIVGAGSLMRAGAQLAISSDNPNGVTDPLTSLRLAVTREVDDGTIFDADEAISREQALRAATAGAVAAIDVDVPGVLVPGAPADLVVVDGDPFTKGARVRQTWIGGRVVHEA
jgi:predicted amidohydrolase YtcJ